MTFRSEIRDRSIIIVDNFSAHVSDEAKSIVHGPLCSVLCELPANCTSVSQPLDVGIMGPFKARLRALWLKDTNVYKTLQEKRHAVISRAIQAWDSITPEMVIKSFKQAIPKPPEQ